MQLERLVIFIKSIGSINFQSYETLAQMEHTNEKSTRKTKESNVLEKPKKELHNQKTRMYGKTNQKRKSIYL